MNAWAMILSWLISCGLAQFIVAFTGSKIVDPFDLPADYKPENQEIVYQLDHQYDSVEAWLDFNMRLPEE